ncbi:P-loop containing nucleoside triphosphate hydrolase protein [Lasiosphaeria hispida]|uniref:P-loop containing nucleoside triphosphate hydrolase protein n=1 Tax=Lasiosphaeria hispida TaxID=260671 RepID=A0AAJ0HXP0_9PEZI|nr:P-loop containing nucleoside triphosphate hydrolase protein [Lasiosphaeria hispida]
MVAAKSSTSSEGHVVNVADGDHDNDTATPAPSNHSSTTAKPQPKASSAFRSYIRVFGYADRLGWTINAISLVAVIGSGIVLPLMNFVFGRFVTVFNNFVIGAAMPDEFRSGIDQYTLYFVYLFLGKFVLSYIWTTLLSANGIRVARSLRIDFLKHTLRQEIAFFDSAEGGSVSNHVTTNISLINQGISEKLGIAIQATSTFVAAFVVAFTVQWKLTLITLCIVPTIVIVVAICMAINTSQEKKIMEVYSRASQLAEEIFSTIRTAHAFWAYPKLSKKYGDILHEAIPVWKAVSPNMAVMFSVEFFCIYSGYGLAFWQGIRMYHRGEIAEPGSVVTVIFAVLLAAQSLTQIAPQTVVVSKAAAAAQHLFEIIDRESKINSLSDEGAKPDECNGEIEFRDVVFAYPSRPDVQVLKSLNLALPANRTTAIVGASGSGKSTIVGLVERWFSPLSGDILLDGRKVEEYNIQWLRTNIRLVQQEPVLFNGTVFQNVANGLSGTPMADLDDEHKRKLVEDACLAAFAHEFIEEMPRGYDTQIGERGAMLSGGQKQRIAIARSVISNPRVLLLDEATSALDPNAERIVQKALNNVAVGRTMVVIAHRLSTIRDADNIVVMSSGSIIEHGTHNKLMASEGAYSRLVLAQDLGQDRDEDDTTDKEAGITVDPITMAKTVSSTAARGQDSPGTLEEGKVGPNHSLLKVLWIIAREQITLWPTYIIMLIACIAAGLTYPAMAILFSRVMEAFALTSDAILEKGDFYSLMFFIVALGNFVAYALIGWFCNVIATQTITYYRHEIFNSIIRQPMSFFDDPANTTGALVTHLSQEPQSVQELLSYNVGVIIIVIVNLLSSCILAITVGWKLGLVLVFGALPPLVFSGYVRIRLEFKLDDDTSARFANSTAIASEAVLAIRTVASLALEKQILDRYEASLRNVAKTSLKSLVWTMFWYSLSQSMSFLAMALGFWYGGRLLSFGEYSATQFYTVFIAVIFSGEAAATFFTYSTSITKAQRAANYIFRLRDSVPPENKDDNPPITEKRGEGGVQIGSHDLEFAYPGRPTAKVLKGVSPQVEPGQFVAFVGASGCGKTTMINLLERFYDPTSGAILFDGVDSTTVHVGTHRSAIALVQQEPVLYQGSIRENIALGVAESEDPASVSDEEIVAACRQANIHTFIESLPEGLGTPCGSQGLQLSGGQRQRIAIARALIRKPRLLLLDEATSSLDTESERVVQAALDAAAKGGEDGLGVRRTTVAVAHRLSTIKGADRIFVFSHGRVAESGSHEELLEARGMYYQMCLGQSLDRAA